MKLYQYYNKQGGLYKLCFYVAVISFIVAVLLIYRYLENRNKKTDETKQKALWETQKAAAKFDEVFGSFISAANTIAEELTYGELNKEDIPQRLRDELTSKYHPFGIGVVYIPYLNDPSIRFNSPYYVSREPISKIDKSDVIKVFAAPIYRIDSATNTQIVTGVVFVDFLLSEVKDIMSSLELGKSGYGFILSKNGTFIAHPINEYNLSEFDTEQKTIFEVADDIEDTQLRYLGTQTVIEKANGILEHRNELTGQDSWMFFQPIPSIEWSLVVVFIKDDIAIDRQSQRNLLVMISVAILIFALSFFTLVSKAYTGVTNRLWLLVVFSSICFITEISYTWFLALEFIIDEDQSYVKIVDRTGVDNFTSGYFKKIRHLCNNKQPYYVPTGIYIESMDFPTAKNVFLSGYVWQKCSNRALNELDTIGIFFPEAIDDDIFLSYTKKEQDYTVYGWHFRITIQTTFDYTKYPLDYKDLLIQISPQDLSTHVILTPDLESYKYLNPGLLPGLAPNIAVRGWVTMYSNFVYKQNKFSLNFGIQDFQCKERAPDLFFNINFTRDFAGTIISKSIPIVVMLFIMFVLLTISTKNIDYVTRILSMSGSFFFAIMFSHVSTRNDLAVQGIVYYEYFFISMYVMILLGFTSAVFYYLNYIQNKRTYFFDYKDNLLSKLIFWPFFLSLFMIITIYFLMVK